MVYALIGAVAVLSLAVLGQAILIERMMKRQWSFMRCQLGIPENEENEKSTCSVISPYRKKQFPGGGDEH